MISIAMTTINSNDDLLSFQFCNLLHLRDQNAHNNENASTKLSTSTVKQWQEYK